MIPDEAVEAARAAIDEALFGQGLPATDLEVARAALAAAAPHMPAWPTREEIARAIAVAQWGEPNCADDAWRELPDMLAAADAVLALLPAPEGWRLVPVKLTPAMACALENFDPPPWEGGDPHGCINELIRVAAAPILADHHSESAE